MEVDFTKLKDNALKFINAKQEKLKDIKALNVYIAIRKSLQPYYNYVPKQQKVTEGDISLHAAKSIDTKESSPVVLRRVNKALLNPWKIKDERQPKIDEIYYFHDEKYHQVWAHFGKGAYDRFHERSDKERRKLKSLIIPVDNNEPSDRTHVIPFGFHGSEKDNILVVEWNGEQNKNDFNNFEQEAKNYNKSHPIFWYTSILNAAQNVLVWEYKIFDADTKQLVSEGEWTFKTKFIWKG